MLSPHEQIQPSSPPPLPPPLIVDNVDGLAALHQSLSAVTRLAVDTESNSLYAYRERVCLIQLSTDRADFLLDPLAFHDPGMFGFLGEIFADVSVEKVFHAAEYDVMGLRRDFGYRVRGIFDTSIGARVLGWQDVGLGAILEAQFGVHINKRHQRANWGLRPLTPALIAYAQLDTHYLLPLRDQLYTALEAANTLEEIRELSREVETAVWTGGQFDPDGFWRITGARSLSPATAAVLRELYLFREAEARRHDLPMFKVLGDSVLVEIAARTPHSFEELRHLGNISAIQLRRYGQGILRCVERGLAAGPLKPPFVRRNGRDDVLARRFDALHAWRKERAARRGVPSDIILSKDALRELAEVAPHSLDQLANIRTLGPWRVSMYGSEILKVLAQVDDGSKPASASPHSSLPD